MLDNFKKIYDEELSFSEDALFHSIMDRSEVRAFVYEVCKKCLNGELHKKSRSKRADAIVRQGGKRIMDEGTNHVGKKIVQKHKLDPDMFRCYLEPTLGEGEERSRGHKMKPPQYTVSRCRKNDTLYGATHGSHNANETLCDLEIDSEWWVILNNCQGNITCKKCLKEIENEETT